MRSSVPLVRCATCAGPFASVWVPGLITGMRPADAFVWANLALWRSNDAGTPPPNPPLFLPAVLAATMWVRSYWRFDFAGARGWNAGSDFGAVYTFYSGGGATYYSTG